MRSNRTSSRLMPISNLAISLDPPQGSHKTLPAARSDRRSVEESPIADRAKHSSISAIEHDPAFSCSDAIGEAGG